MALHENYHNASSKQCLVAAGASILGGIIVLILGLMGAFGDYGSLVRMGFGVWTIPCYAIVVLCGLFIFARVKFAVAIALIAAALEIVLYFCTQLSTTPDVGFLVLLKVAVIICLFQLARSIYSFDEDEDDNSNPPPPRRHVGPAPPQARRVVSRQQPPRPRR